MGIKKIARLAGVSIGTVDRALNGRGRVSAETKKKIEEIARQINYRPNLMASSLSKKRKITIAILAPDPAQDEYWQQAWMGFESLAPKAEKQGIHMKTYFYSLDNQELFDEYSEQIISERPDGLILAPNFPDSSSTLVNRCFNASIPVILFDTNLPDTTPFCFIGTDLHQSGMLCAQLLEMITHQEGSLVIFHIDASHSKSQDMIEKENGFIEYLKASKSTRTGQSFLIDSHRNLDAQLDDVFKNDIAGCFVSTSKTWLIGEYLKKRDRTDIKLIGFDLITKNIELLKEGWIDFLINQNPARQARKSLNTFINHFAFQEDIKEKEYLPIEIIAKGSLTPY